MSYKTDVGRALDNLRGFAENLVINESNRRIQLSREKEQREIDAYNYLNTIEGNEIARIEGALNQIESNLMAKGIELEALGDQYKSINAEELLNAANTSAAEMLSVQLEQRQNYKEALEIKRRDAQKLLRHIDAFDEYIMDNIDPSVSGEKHLVDAKDVADAAINFLEEKDSFNAKHSEEITQRLKDWQTEDALSQLQQGFYSRQFEDQKAKADSLQLTHADAKMKIEALDPLKKEAQEGLVAMTQIPVSRMIEQYGVIITRQSELDNEELDRTSDIAAAEQAIEGEQARLGSILYPWAFSQEQSMVLAQNFQTALSKIAKNNDYSDLINYLKQGSAQYKLWLGQGDPIADTYRSDMQSMFGIDIASDSWLSQLIDLFDVSGKIDIEQAVESLKIAKSILPPDAPPEDNFRSDLDEFMQGGDK